MALFHSFYGWVIFHCVSVPHLLYPFLCMWTFILLAGLTIVNSADMNMGPNESFQVVFFFLDICPIVGLLDQMVVLFLIFWGTSIWLSILVLPIYIPSNSIGEFPFLHTLSSIYFCRLFMMAILNRCDVITHCDFDYHSLIISNLEHLFMVFFFFLPSVCIPGECLFKYSANILIGLFAYFYWTAWVICIFWRLILCQ